ncbi:hypothetical protein [Acidovorax carolinensis]|uniref:hypothetical protein n=1 Tax=Acidovorax carolinensis TaxID=553814 RepID=UPI001ABF326D|nr:hypothetical protein [Acidovorax carolinensis]
MAKKQQRVGAAARLLWSVSPIVDIGRDGWPVKLHVQAIAALQSWCDGDGEETPERKERMADWAYAIRGACTDSKTLAHERRVLRQNPMVMGGDVVGVVTDSACYITAQDFSGWLAAHGESPGPLVQLWFEAQGVACPATAVTPAAPVESSASSAPAWTVTKPQRYSGYAAPLHRLLVTAHREGRPRPTARDVLEAWRINKPAEIAKVLPDGFDYYDANGNAKPASLEAIRKSINRLTSAR